MPGAVIEWVGQTARDAANASANTSELLNCYRQPVEAGGRTRYVLKAVLGQEAFSDIGSVFMRAMKWEDGAVYSITGGALYEIGDLGGYTRLADVPDSVQTGISSNFGNITIAADGKYLVWDGTAIAEITGGAFSNIGSVDHLSGYTMLTELDGQKIGWSVLADAKTLDATHVAAADARNDKIIRGITISDAYWVFCERSTEIWYLTGQPGADAFIRASGGVFDAGLKSYGLVARYDGGGFFVGDDGIAYAINGGGITPISTPSLETDLKNADPQNCMYYEDDGARIGVIQFSDIPAWCIDFRTGEWHRRSEGNEHGPWSAVAAVNNGTDWLIGTDSGNVNRLTRNNSDLGESLHRRAVSRTLYINGSRFRVPELEIFLRKGKAEIGGDVTFVLFAAPGWALGEDSFAIEVSSESGEMREPQIFIRTSGDGAHSWSLEKWRGLGMTGDYDKRVMYRALGQFRQLTIEVNMTEKAEIPIYADCLVRTA